MNDTLLNASFMKDSIEILTLMYSRGWDERNGGNYSYLIKEAEIKEYIDLGSTYRRLALEFCVKELSGCFFLVTGTGKYFRNVKKDPSNNLGIIRIAADGTTADVIWGYDDGGLPTSELSSHLMGHCSRLNQDKAHRVVMHCHPTNLIAMTSVAPLNEKKISQLLWRMISECLVVFPDGLGIVPWMVPGQSDLGKVTASKMERFRAVLWPHHGLFGTGRGIDEAFGLIETVEKAAEIYLKVASVTSNPLQAISTTQLKALADAFGVTVQNGFLDDE